MIFNNDALRQEFISLYGCDKPGAKFKIDDMVIFKAKDEQWVGKVQAVNWADVGVYEYLIEGSPILAWESQLHPH